MSCPHRRPYQRLLLLPLLRSRLSHLGLLCSDLSVLRSRFTPSQASLTLKSHNTEVHHRLTWLPLAVHRFQNLQTTLDNQTLLHVIRLQLLWQTDHLHDLLPLVPRLPLVGQTYRHRLWLLLLPRLAVPVSANFFGRGFE